MQDYEPPPPSSSWIWIIGTLVFVSGSLLNFASYAFAPQVRSEMSQIPEHLLG